MKNFLLLAAVTLMGLGSIAQNGKVIEDQHAQKRGVTGYHSIEVSGGIDLYLTQGNDEAVAVSAAALSDRDRIVTEVEGGVLKIHMEKGFYFSSGDRKRKAYVAFKTLDALRASGGSDVYVEDVIQVPKLNLDMSGGSDLKGKGKVSIGDLSIVQSGGSDVYIAGTATTLSVHATGGSDLHAYDLLTDNCHIEVSGGSDVRITANKELSVSASGGSDVYYKGSAVIRDLHASGSSDVTRKG